MRCTRSAVAAAEGARSAQAISNQRASHLYRRSAKLEAKIQKLTCRGHAMEARLRSSLEDTETARTAAAAERAEVRAHVRRVED